MRYFKHLCSNFNMVIVSEVLSFDFFTQRRHTPSLCLLLQCDANV